MAYADNYPALRMKPSSRSRVVGAVLDTLLFFATVGQRCEALRQLTRMNDEDLDMRGTTRSEEIRRIVGIEV